MVGTAAAVGAATVGAAVGEAGAAEAASSPPEAASPIPPPISFRKSRRVIPLCGKSVCAILFSSFVLSNSQLLVDGFFDGPPPFRAEWVVISHLALTLTLPLTLILFFSN